MSSHTDLEKPEETQENHLDVIRTISKVPDNPNYYEKDGLRTEGDGVDHSHYNPVTYNSHMNHWPH